MAMANDDRELMRALDTIEEETTALGVGGAAGAFELPEVDPAKRCPAYRNLRPSLELVVRVVGVIPVWGSKAAMGIQFAMTVADLACPAEEATEAPAAGIA